MKNITFFLLAVSSLLFSCNNQNTENKEENISDSAAKVETSTSDYSGTYKADEPACTISITLSKSGEQYTYSIAEDKKQYTGNLSIEDSNGDIYFTFGSEIGENKAGSLSAKYEENTLTIQNYGNAMNEFHFFKQCDLKYIVFTKQN